MTDEKKLNTSITLPEALRLKIEALAAQEKRTRNLQIELLLEEAVAARETKRKDAA